MVTGQFCVLAFQDKPAVSGVIESQCLAFPTGFSMASQTVLRPLVAMGISVAANTAFIVETDVTHAACIRGSVRSVTCLAQNPLVGALEREVSLIVIERVWIKIDQRRIPASMFAVTAPAGPRKRAVKA